MSKSPRTNRQSRVAGTVPSPSGNPFAPGPAARFGGGSTSPGLVLISLTALQVATVLLPSEAAVTQGNQSVLVLLLLLVVLLALAQRMATSRDASAQASHVPAVSLLLLACGLSQVGSGLVMLSAGNGRWGINQMWSLAAIYLTAVLTGHYFRASRRRDALLTVMLATAFAIALLGLYQNYVSLPRARAEYAQSAASIRQQLQLDELSGTALRTLFEARLRTAEPFGRFALSNSLAGFLVCWWLVAVAVWFRVTAAYQGARRQSAMTGTASTKSTDGRHQATRQLLTATCLGLLVLIVLAWCLWLTHSRSAYIAVVVGSCLSGINLRQLRPAHPAAVPLDWRRWAAGIVIAGTVGLLILGYLVMTGDELIANAPRSLRFRAEYWQATWRMVGDYPWFGCGPGQFQTYYTHYMLPQSSEAVADPHNWLLETAATAGAPTAVLLLLTLGLIGYAGFTKESRPGSPLTSPPYPGDPNRRLPSPSASDFPTARWILGGGVAGIIVGAVVSRLTWMPLELFLAAIAVPVACLVGYGLHRGLTLASEFEATSADHPFAFVSLAAGLALLLHLTFTGGINYAGVANSLWMLLLFGAADGSQPRVNLRDWHKLLPICLLAVGALLLLNYGTLYRPVLTASKLLQEGQLAQLDARQALAERNGRFVSQRLSEAAAAFTAAWEADRWSSVATLQLASVRHDQWQMDPGNEALWRSFEESLNRATERDPRNFAVAARAAEWHLFAYRLRGRTEDLAMANEHQSRAISLFPAAAILRAQAAWLQHLQGNAAAAAEEARIALLLDDAHDHVEKKLTARRIVDPGAADRSLRQPPAPRSDATAAEIVRSLLANP